MSEKTANNLTQEYWDKLLSQNTSLKGVGWPNWPESYNLILYKKYLKGFENVINELSKNYSFLLNDKINVFETGPGTGFYTNYFYRAGVKNYTGADISEESVKNLKVKYTEFNFVRKDISEDDEFVKDNTGKFDLICIVDVLLHITDDTKFKRAVKNISSLVKPGGFIIVGDAISIYRKTNHAEGSKYTHDVSRHIDYLNEQFNNGGAENLKIYHRYNYLLNKNFDFKYPVFDLLNKPFFWLLNGGLTVFRNNDFIGKLAGYPLSVLDSVITPFQKYSKNSKFILYRKNN
ncbi:MAG: class I SAM-dependent methyltransferase [Ignavibacteria bacterium]|nr:class I SAM-dependent methyltransferase [Ignavibacteria bacterium]